MARKPKKGPRYEINRRYRAKAFMKARLRMSILLRRLGGKCSECGEHRRELLSVDHVDGITWERRRLRYDARAKKYWAEFKAGIRLRVLCLPCNGRDGRARQLEEEAPF